MKNFILNNSSWVKRYLVRRYPLPVSVIERHVEHVDWEILSENDAIDYTEEFCAKYEDRIDWEYFKPLKSSIFKGEGRDDRWISFLDRFKDKLEWYYVSSRLTQAENPEKVLDYFKEYWKWDSISMNEDLIWTTQLLRSFRDKINWSSLCCNPEIEWRYVWMLEFEECIDWENLYNYSKYEWNMTSVLRFRKRFREVGIEPDLREYISINEKEESEAEYWSRPSLYRECNDSSRNKYFDYCVCFDEFKELIEKHCHSLDKINFNENILWTNQAFAYILDFKDIDILHLSTHSRFEDPVAILRKYGDLLNWGCKNWEELPKEIAEDATVMVYKGISSNKYIPWSEEMLDEFQDKIHWEILSKEARIIWTKGIIKKYFHRFDKLALLKEDSYPGHNPLFLEFIIPEMDESLIEVVMGYCGN